MNVCCWASALGVPRAVAPLRSSNGRRLRTIREVVHDTSWISLKVIPNKRTIVQDLILIREWSRVDVKNADFLAEWFLKFRVARKLVLDAIGGERRLGNGELGRIVDELKYLIKGYRAIIRTCWGPWHVRWDDADAILGLESTHPYAGSWWLSKTHVPAGDW